MTKTVYATNRNFLTLTDIKVVSRTTMSFASDTKHVSLPSTHDASSLRPFPYDINKFMSHDWFAASADLPPCHKEL